MTASEVQPRAPLPVPCPRRPGPTSPAMPPGHPGSTAALPVPRAGPASGGHLRAPSPGRPATKTPEPLALANPRRYRSAAAGDQRGAAAPQPRSSAAPIAAAAGRRRAPGGRRPTGGQGEAKAGGPPAPRGDTAGSPRHLPSGATRLRRPGAPAPRGLARRYRPEGRVTWPGSSSARALPACRRGLGPCWQRGTGTAPAPLGRCVAPARGE